MVHVLVARSHDHWGCSSMRFVRIIQSSGTRNDHKLIYISCIPQDLIPTVIGGFRKDLQRQQRIKC